MNYSDYKIINIPEKSIPGLIRDEIREEKYTQAIDNGEELIDTKVTRKNFYNDENEIIDAEYNVRLAFTSSDCNIHLVALKFDQNFNCDNTKRNDVYMTEGYMRDLLVKMKEVA